MSNHILVILESARFAEYILAHAQSIANAAGGKITLMRIFDPASAKGRSRIVDPLDWHIRKMEAEASLNKLAESLNKKGLSVATSVLEGSDSEQLIQYAQTHDVDFIILTKQSENVGDLAHSVMKRTSIPTVILPVGGYWLKDANATDCYEKILVPLDGSQRAEITLPIATSFAHNCGAQIVLAHVVHRPEMPRHAPPNVEEIELVERIVTLNQTEAARYLENIASRLSTDVQTRLLVSNNVAASLHHLVEEEHIDLVVLSAHGYSGEPQWPYGSVTSHLIAYSKTPVLVVQDLPAAAPPSIEKPAVARSGKAINA